MNDQDHGQPNLGKELQSSEGDSAPIKPQPPIGGHARGWALNSDMAGTAAYPQFMSVSSTILMLTPCKILTCTRDSAVGDAP
jgi:hypothetical protein